ncbi:hypothetical protein QE152_g14126 [Popillia japonica]|uniref:Uncharacterized protein n=1 Tax=Popillia japonica TaxID=7064 RepID=A0AAW1LAE0_POPJA
MRTRSKEPLLSHEVPELPFQKVASDILEYNGTNMRTSKEPLLSHEVPELPFQKVASDILEYNGISYVVVDYLTKWLEIVPLQSKKSPGVPDVVVSLRKVPGYRTLWSLITCLIRHMNVVSSQKTLVLNLNKQIALCEI